VIRLLAAELHRLRTTRASYGLALGLLAIVTLFTVGQVVTVDEFAPRDIGRQTLEVLSASGLFSFIFGILLASGEYRHRTISQSFLVTPLRWQVVLAKLVAGALAGFALTLAAGVVSVVIAEVGFAAQDIQFSLGDEGVARLLGTMLLAGVLWGALGAGVGSIVTNQVAAIVGSLAWLFVVESLLGSLVPDVGRYLPGVVFGELTDTGFGVEGGLSALGGGALAAAYVAVSGVLGVLLTARRDIT